MSNEIEPEIEILPIKKVPRSDDFTGKFFQNRYARPCLLQYDSQAPKYGNNILVQFWMNR